MSCIFLNCLERASALCLCKKTSFFCDKHSKSHKDCCRSPQININSENTSKAIQQKIANLKYQVKSASMHLTQTIESICESYLSELNTLELCLHSESSLPEISIKSELFDQIKTLIEEYLGMSDFLFSSVLMNDLKSVESQEYSFSTFESSEFLNERKNPVGIFLDKCEGMAWLRDNGLEFDEEQINEITVNEDRSLGFLCRVYSDCKQDVVDGEI